MQDQQHNSNTYLNTNTIYRLLLAALLIGAGLFAYIAQTTGDNEQLTLIGIGLFITIPTHLLLVSHEESERGKVYVSNSKLPK